MAKNEDGTPGAAVIDLGKVETGKGDKLPQKLDDLDNLDFGDDIEDEVEETPEKPEKDEKKDKKAEKKEKKPAKKEEKAEDDDEVADEDAEEEEEAAEDDAEVEDEPKKQVKMVPQARLMAVKTRLEQQLRDAQTELAKLASQSGNKAKAEEFESKLSDLYINLEKARAAGNVEESAKLARQLDALKDDASKRQSQVIAQIEARNQLEQRLYDTVLAELEQAAPQTNPDSDDFDQELVNDLDAAIRGYEAQGLTPSEALKKAAKRLIGKDVFDPKSIRREKQPEPKKTDVKKNAEAVKKTPPSAVKEERTERSQDIKVTQMSREDFNKLPEATQRRLLGDEL